MALHDDIYQACVEDKQKSLLSPNSCENASSTYPCSKLCPCHLRDEYIATAEKMMGATDACMSDALPNDEQREMEKSVSMAGCFAVCEGDTKEPCKLVRAARLEIERLRKALYEADEGCNYMHMYDEELCK